MGWWCRSAGWRLGCDPCVRSSYWADVVIRWLSLWWRLVDKRQTLKQRGERVGMFLRICLAREVHIHELGDIIITYYQWTAPNDGETRRRGRIWISRWMVTVGSSEEGTRRRWMAGDNQSACSSMHRSIAERCGWDVTDEEKCVQIDEHCGPLSNIERVRILRNVLIYIYCALWEWVPTQTHANTG